MIFTPVEGIAGAWVLDPERISDSRGWFARTYAVDEFISHGLDPTIVQVSSSYNEHAGTLRGMHLQREPFGETKLIRCTSGRVYDVMVDVRKVGPGFGTWAAFELDPETGRSVYLPPGVAHGFMTLEPGSELSYQIGAPYQADAAIGFRWDDPAVAITWPREPTVLSDRDGSLPLAADLVYPEAP